MTPKDTAGRVLKRKPKNPMASTTNILTPPQPEEDKSSFPKISDLQTDKEAGVEKATGTI
jgi:hypothetical protein